MVYAGNYNTITNTTRLEEKMKQMEDNQKDFPSKHGLLLYNKIYCIS